jgi:hypothetical protein
MAGSPTSSREAWERRKEEIGEAMMPFVRQSDSHLMMRNQYEQIGAIVEGCSKLSKTDGAWVPEFMPGTEIRNACHVAWTIHCHTKMPVRFSFNGVQISFGEKECA